MPSRHRVTPVQTWRRRCSWEGTRWYRIRGRKRFLDDADRCCEPAWLSRGWCCRSCGKTGDAGSFQAACGIYGGRFWARAYMPSGCECGWELKGWNNFNWASCGSCWWVCTVQLVSRLMELLGPWSEIHDCIWLCLIESPQWGVDLEEAMLAQLILLAQVREYGRFAETVPALCKVSPRFYSSF